MNLPVKISLVLITLTAGFYAPDVIKYLKENIESPMQLRSIDQYCMLSKQSCVQDSITITLDKDVLKPMVSSKMNVVWSRIQSSGTLPPNKQPSNKQPPKLILTMKGLEGELGTVKYILKHVGDNNYVGDITLPVCTLDEMTWLGELTDGTKTVYPALRMKS
jgi:hypothetical protein